MNLFPRSSRRGGCSRLQCPRLRRTCHGSPSQTVLGSILFSLFNDVFLESSMVQNVTTMAASEGGNLAGRLILCLFSHLFTLFIFCVIRYTVTHWGHLPPSLHQSHLGPPKGSDASRSERSSFLLRQTCGFQTTF
jgi:hypothetical protein